MKWKQFLMPVKSMDSSEAKEYISQHREGDYLLLDVRQPWEYEEERLPGARLVPMGELPSKMNDLNPEMPTIVYCAVGGRSRAASQLLAGQGFSEVYNLTGGIKAWHGYKAEGKKTEGADILTGDESPEDIIMIAYGMEEGLGSFYRHLAARAEDNEIAGLFNKLSKVEESHKAGLIKLYKTFKPNMGDIKDFEERTLSNYLEGGLTTDEFIKRNEIDIDSVRDVLELAMIIETQAFDLYMRFGEKVTDEKSRSLLHKIAEDEKGHIKRLGELMVR